SLRLQTVAIDPFLRRLPDMTRDRLLLLVVTRALRQPWAAPAPGRVRLVMTVSLPVGGRVAQRLPLRTAVDIVRLVVNEQPLGHHPLAFVRPAVTDHPIQLALVQTLADRRREVPRVQAHRFHLEPEPL